MSHHASAEEHYKSYVKIWATLVVLLIISVIGPFIGEATGIFAITLVTAFGIAIVKATMVMAYFMHLNVEMKYIWYLFASAATALVVLWAGLFPDITNDRGASKDSWINCERNRYAYVSMQKAKSGGEHGAEAPVASAHEAAPAAEGDAPVFCGSDQIL